MALAFASGTITVTGGATAGTATSGSTTTIADTGKSWTTNQWAGRHVWIHTGTANGQWRVVLSNTATVLTVDRAFSVAINNTSQYIVAHNFADVLAANNAGAWGVVSGAGGQYRLAARIFIGDGTSGNRGCFGDLNKSITFTSGSITSAAFTGADFWSYTHILLKDFSAMLFGNVLNATNKVTVDGMSFLSEVVSPPGIAFTIGRYNIAGAIPTNPSLAVIASCKFGRTASRTIFYVPATNGESYLWNCDFDRVELNPGVLDTFNVTVQGGIYGIARVAGAFDRAIVAGIAGPAVYASPLGEVAGVTFRNLITRNCTSWFQFFDNPTLDVFMVNPDPDVRTITAVGTPGGSARLWEQYEFDLTVRRASDSTAISGARIRLTDSTDAEVFNNVTDANGAIATQTLNRGFYTRVNLSTLTARTPHVMRIRRYGFLPFQLGLNATVKQAFNDFRAADAFVVASEATAGAYTGIAINGVAKTITISAARTVQELYDFVQWWQVQSGNIQYDVSLTTADGINYIITSGWTLIGAANLTFGSRSFSGALRFTAAGAYSPRLGTATVTFTAAGTYDLRGATISGTITLINTSAGAVTVQLQPGVTFVNSGPSITVDNAATVTLTVNNIVAGSRIQIYNATTATEIVNQVVTGTSFVYNYTETVGITNGNLIRVRLAYQSGITARVGFQTFGLASLSNWTILADQQTDTVYGGIGIDGSTVSEFSPDYPNIQVDINDPDGVTTLSRLYAWFSYICTSADGIRNWLGGIVAEDNANFKIVTSLLNLRLDNVSALGVQFIGDIRLFRDDGAAPVVATTTGGGSITLYAGKVYVVTTGGSALTPSESAKLMGLPDSAANASAVLTAAQAAPIHADVRKANNVAVVATDGSTLTPSQSAKLLGLPDGSTNAAAVLAAAQSTPIHADIRAVNAITVDGAGTEANPFGPA